MYLSGPFCRSDLSAFLASYLKEWGVRPSEGGCSSTWPLKCVQELQRLVSGPCFGPTGTGRRMWIMFSAFFCNQVCVSIPHSASREGAWLRMTVPGLRQGQPPLRVAPECEGSPVLPDAPPAGGQLLPPARACEEVPSDSPESLVWVRHCPLGAAKILCTLQHEDQREKPRRMFYL